MTEYEPVKELLITFIRADKYDAVTKLVNDLDLDMAAELIVALATEVSILRRGR